MLGRQLCTPPARVRPFPLRRKSYIEMPVGLDFFCPVLLSRARCDGSPSHILGRLRFSQIPELPFGPESAELSPSVWSRRRLVYSQSLPVLPSGRPTTLSSYFSAAFSSPACIPVAGAPCFTGGGRQEGRSSKDGIQLGPCGSSPCQCVWGQSGSPAPWSPARGVVSPRFRESYCPRS